MASPDAAADWLRLPAPAKVNLGLRVVGRRDDGYHRLESLFVPLDLVDDVALRLREAVGPSQLHGLGSAPEPPRNGASEAVIAIRVEPPAAAPRLALACAKEEGEAEAAAERHLAERRRERGPRR